MYVCIFACMYVYMCVCVSMYVTTYVYVYVVATTLEYLCGTHMISIALLFYPIFGQILVILDVRNL